MNNGVSVTSGLADAMLAQSPAAEHLEVTAVKSQSNSVKLWSNHCSNRCSNSQNAQQIMPEPVPSSDKVYQGGFRGKETKI